MGSPKSRKGSASKGKEKPNRRSSFHSDKEDDEEAKIEIAIVDFRNLKSVRQSCLSSLHPERVVAIVELNTDEAEPGN